MTTTVVFIPYWIAHTLRRRNLPYSTIFNFKEMLQYFSHQDLASFLATNQPERLGVLNVTEMGVNPNPPVTAASSSAPDQLIQDAAPQAIVGWIGNEWSAQSYDQSDKALQEAEGSIRNLSYLVSTHQAVVSRLYSEDGKEAQFEEAFKQIDLGRNYVGIVIHPGYFIENTDNSIDAELKYLRQYELTRTILMALYVQAPGYHLVASSPVFLRYLGLLSKKRMILA